MNPNRGSARKLEYRGTLGVCGSINTVLFHGSFGSDLFSQLSASFGSTRFAIHFGLATARKPFSSPLGAVPLPICVAWESLQCLSSLRHFQAELRFFLQVPFLPPCQYIFVESIRQSRSLEEQSFLKRETIRHTKIYIQSHLNVMNLA